jgi:hypothetical protein
MKNKLKKDKVASPAQQLESVMAARHRSQVEISELRAMLAEKSARQAALETAGDLGESAVLSEIGKLQVLVELLPRRIAFREAEDVKAEEALVQATNTFIQEHLGPRARQLETRTREIVEKELSRDISEPSALMRAVARSERVQSVERLALAVSLRPPGGAVMHAERTLKAWGALGEFESALPPESVTADLSVN